MSLAQWFKHYVLYQERLINDPLKFRKLIINGSPEFVRPALDLDSIFTILKEFDDVNDDLTWLKTELLIVYGSKFDNLLRSPILNEISALKVSTSIGTKISDLLGLNLSFNIVVSTETDRSYSIYYNNYGTYSCVTFTVEGASKIIGKFQTPFELQDHLIEIDDRFELMI